MEHFTPLTAIIGGVLIGLAVSLLWITNRRLAGVSSISGAIFPLRRNDMAWRLMFLVGLPAGAIVGWSFGPLLFAEIPASRPTIELGSAGLIVAGLLVGIGTRLGSGCTSGHGICGLARLSSRSLAAVAIFMATAAATVYVTRHVIS